jgi:hypothetical protein
MPRGERPTKSPTFDIKVAHCNIQGAQAHTSQLNDTLASLTSCPQIIVTTETHHRPNQVYNDKIKDYNWLGQNSNRPIRGTGF